MYVHTSLKPLVATGAEQQQPIEDFVLSSDAVQLILQKFDLGGG